jgi:ferric-dicitrate binding protein FerR (iron transport regulator)
VDDRARHLISGHFSSSLTPDEGAELVRLATVSAEVRDELADQAAMHRWLHLRAARPLDIDTILKALPKDRATAEHVLERLPRRISRRGPQRTPTLWWSVAAAALVLITCLVWLRTRAAYDGFLVMASSGINTLTHMGVVSAVTPLARITPGDLLSVGESGVVTVQAVDGSTLVLDVGASLLVRDDRRVSVELELKHGRVLATVVPRAGNEQFSLHTPHAEVVVIGTRFTVAVEANRTSLDVADGRVRFTPRGGTTRVVAANESATWPTRTEAPPVPTTPRFVDLVPLADADADEARPSTSFGGEKTLRLNGTKPGKERVSLLRFALPPGRVTHAELLLHHLSGTGTVQVSVQREAGSWQENDLRFYHVPPRGPLAGALHDEAGLWRCDVTAAVHAGTLEFMLVNTAPSEVTFASREETGHAPILRLTMDASIQP